MPNYRLCKQRRALGKNKGKTVWVAQSVRLGRITSRGLVADLSQGTTVGKADALAVLGQLSEVLPSLLRLGHSVQIDGIGSFRLVVKSEEVEREEDFDVRLHMKPPSIVFHPAPSFAFACTNDLHYHRC